MKAVRAVGAAMPSHFGADAGPQKTLCRTGKITYSFPKKGFRVFVYCSVSNPSDTTVKFASYERKRDAWEAALTMIDELADA